MVVVDCWVTAGNGRIAMWQTVPFFVPEFHISSVKSSDWQATQKKEIGVLPPAREGAGTPYNGPYEEALPERGTVFSFR